MTLQSSDEKKINCCQLLPSTQSSLSATLESIQRLSGGTILASVEALGRNVVMLPIGTAVEGYQRTLVRQGPRESHQSQGVINGVCRAVWLSKEKFLQSKVASDSILITWLIRHAAWSLTRFQVKSDERTAFVRVFWKAYSRQVLPMLRKSDVQSKMARWYLGWQSANDRRALHS